MIYLAALGKKFGPFTPEELTPSVLSEYSWILDLREQSPKWKPLDPVPTDDRVTSERTSVDTLVFSRDSAQAVSGALEQIRLRSGLLVTEEQFIRLQPGSSVEIILSGRPPTPATIESVDYSERRARYRLRWLPIHAPT
jgi:hypothetical protein